MDSETKLYGSIIDLNASKMIREELKPTNAEKDLRKSVLVTLSLSTEIRWKKDIPLTMIKMYSKFREQGLPNTIKDIKKIN